MLSCPRVKGTRENNFDRREGCHKGVHAHVRQQSSELESIKTNKNKQLHDGCPFISKHVNVFPSNARDTKLFAINLSMSESEQVPRVTE